MEQLDIGYSITKCFFVLLSCMEELCIDPSASCDDRCAHISSHMHLAVACMQHLGVEHATSKREMERTRATITTAASARMQEKIKDSSEPKPSKFTLN